MFRASISTEQSVAAATVRLLRAALRRLGGLLRDASPRAIEYPAAENGFYALDDVACIRIRRR